MGRGSHGKKYLRIRRRKHKAAVKEARKLNMKAAKTLKRYFEELKSAEYSNFSEIYEDIIKGDIPISNLPNETGICIKAENTKTEKRPLPKNPELEDMASYLKEYCTSMAELFPKEHSYCIDRCYIRDICLTLDLGNFSIDVAKVPEAFYTLRKDYR